MHVFQLVYLLVNGSSIFIFAHCVTFEQKYLDRGVQTSVDFSFKKLKHFFDEKMIFSSLTLLATSCFKWSSLCLFSLSFNPESVILNRIVLLISLHILHD